MLLRIRTFAFSCVLALFAPAAGAQSMLDRGPNLSDGWIGAPNSIHFNFLHRFNQSGPPQRQVTNRPTFELAWRPPVPILVGVRYATRSDVVARIPNEWELFARYGALRQDNGALIDAAATAAWNEAARSMDGEVTLARRQGPLRVIGAARVLGSAFDTGDTRFALAAGGTVRLSRWIALAGDVAQLLDQDERAAWGGAVQIAIPYTPHSVSLQATNTNTATLHGASRGADAVRWGFEFTVPIALGRYFGTRVVAAPPPPPRVDLDSLRLAVADSVTDSVTRALQSEYELRLRLDAEQRASREDSLRVEALRVARQDSVRAAARADSLRQAEAARARRPPAVVRATIRNLAFAPARIEITAGTTIRWTNSDQVDHTVTATDGSWDSGIIRPGQTWERTFATPGAYDFFCTPHPFMKGTVVVRPAP